MTELNSYSINKNLSISKGRVEITPTSNNTVEYSQYLHYPRLDSKAILQNMEEVLDSVNKQHKEKHRRKKEQRKLALIEAANRSEIVSSTNGLSTDKKTEHSEKKHRNKDKDKRRSKKKPLQEKSAVENGEVFYESPIKSGTILQHFLRTPRKEENKDLQVEECEVNAEEKIVEIGILSPPNSSKPTNAFEVMMNARNKSIGSNTPGKDCTSPAFNKEVAATNAKRKLKLQEWAEQKGAVKRKIDEARALYVDEQLEQRAKRFKKMLVSGGGSPKKSCAIIKNQRKAKNSKTKLKENSQKNKLRKRSGMRSRRISSVEYVDNMEQLETTIVDSETVEFLAKLNSPTKKKDSLLGYFQKSEYGEEKKCKETKINAIKTSRKTISCYSTPDEKINNLKKNIEKEITTSSARPRRSCVGKARYDYDLERSPTKTIKNVRSWQLQKSSERQKCAPNLQVNEEQTVETIDLDESTNMSGCSDTVLNCTPKKLAPLFVRSLPKPSPDPEKIRARKAFLQSGVPDKLRLEQEKQKQYEQTFEEATEIFPKISHVKQLNRSELESDRKIRKYSLLLRSEESIFLSPPQIRKAKVRSNKRQSIFGILSDYVTQPTEMENNRGSDFHLDQISLPSIGNKRAIIKNWKLEFERFPTYKCYNQMREKYRYFSAIDSVQDTEQVSESFVVTRQTRRSLENKNKKESYNQDEEYVPPATAPNGELLFSEKYKPLLFEQVLVNLNPVTQLKEFLSNWSNNGTTSARNSQTLDDILDINDFTCSNQGPSSNTVVLLGPISSGKTNAVFALANDMNFNVLEINAGMKRTGKRLIQELQEATQSHQIRKDASCSGFSQKNLLKMSLNGLTSKVKKQNSNSNQIEQQNSDSSSSDLQQTARKCLILIEDADVVFEQTDAGFTDAIYSLVASSKRPVIVVASNPNCSHLQRLISQNTIHFSPPNVLNISRFLAVLSLIENCPVQLDDIISLYLYNHRDLRKTLLELQFFIQSGGDRQLQFEHRRYSKTTAKGNANYFASPRKRQFSIEQRESEVVENNIFSDRNCTNMKSSEKSYMHRSLFEYYTMSQNLKWRIPFPIDFHILNANLCEIFKVSRKLKEEIYVKISDTTTKNTNTKRKSKSPKKQWLNTARGNLKTPLDNLCMFYENLSIAALMSDQNNILRPSIIDRVKPIFSETISHCVLEKAIDVNLEAEQFPYNLFNTPKNSISLCEQLGSIQLRSYRARYLDYEPSLRSICRSEKQRSSLERRSTRFYHYLRNYFINISNFSTTHFDQACEAFHIVDVAENQET